MDSVFGCVMIAVMAVGWASAIICIVSLMQSTQKLSLAVAEHNRLIEALGDAWKEMADSIRETVDKQVAPRRVALTPADEAENVMDGKTLKPVLDGEGKPVQVAIDRSDVVADAIELDARQTF
jgi:hypothetical protein